MFGAVRRRCFSEAKQRDALPQCFVLIAFPWLDAAWRDADGKFAELRYPLPPHYRALPLSNVALLADAPNNKKQLRKLRQNRIER